MPRKKKEVKEEGDVVEVKEEKKVVKKIKGDCNSIGEPFIDE